MTRNALTKKTRIIIILCICFIMAGCAASPASYKTIQNINPDIVLKNYKTLELTAVKADDSVPITEVAMERIVDDIIGWIETENPDFYDYINPTVVKEPAVQANIIFTKYDKGNAFARAMLAGLGQMHIDAELILKDKNAQKVIAKYEINKTFAWGGTVGAFTEIEDCEEGFAKAAAKLLLK